MLARISGVVESVEGASVVIGEPEHGERISLAYQVLVPAFTGATLSERVGERVTLHTVEVYEGSAAGNNFVPRVIGFESRSDRAFFELFTKVKGLGSRKALRALAMPVPRIADAIAKKDAKALQLLPEIGKRLAETIVVDLHGKVDDFLTPSAADDRAAVVVDVKSDVVRQAISALVRLGEREDEARRLVEAAAERDPEISEPDAMLAAALAER
ncbi:MAG: Holliday junction branch migration protein RuvA [Planctomycetota bacterium]